MSIRMIATAFIDAGGRLRTLDPTWVQVLAEDIGAVGQSTPIRVVERGEGFKLVDGARRLAAVLQLGHDEIEARIEAEDALADDAAVRLGEIKGNMLRGDLTALDRAVYIAAWCDIYQATQEPPRRGRKPARPATDHDLDEMSAKLALNWTEAAQAALGIGRRSIFRAQKVAGIDAVLRSRIALLPIGNNQSELLLLAEQNPARQSAIVDMLTADPAKAVSASEAITLLDNVAPAQALPAYERFHQRFCALRQAEREKFFELNAEDIERWIAQRRAASTSRKAAA